MEKAKSNLLFGGLLVVVGLAYLLNNLDIIFIESEVTVSMVFWAIGAYLFSKFSTTKGIGFLIAGVISTFIGLVIWLESIPGFDDQFIGVIVLWTAAALFAVGFLRNSENWGFLIPTGILFTTGSMVWLDMILYNDDVLGSVFFLGLGATFGFLYLIKNEKNKLDWAKVPALCLVAFSGFLFLVTSDSLITDMFFPIILILLGGYLVYSATKQKPFVKQPNNT